MTKGRWKLVSTGVRKDLTAKGRKKCFQAYIKINGKQKTRSFFTASEAKEWRVTVEKESEQSFPIEGLSDSVDSEITFERVWNLFINNYVKAECSQSTLRTRIKMVPFFEGLFNVKMSDFTSKVLTAHVRIEKEKSINNEKSKRCNFTQELKVLNAVFNWWRDESDDEKVISPVSRKHHRIGNIQETPHKHKKMSKEELIKFIDGFEENCVFKDLAKTQFHIAGRIAEAAGLQSKYADLLSREVLVKETLDFGYDKKPVGMNKIPKNKVPKPVYMTDTLYEILKRRREKAAWCDVGGVEYLLLFHDNGKALSYRQIQYQYNKALKKAGLDHKYSATHFLRHSMGTMARMVTGSLDSAQAVGGWKDQKTAEIYCSIENEVQKEALIAVEGYLKA